LNHQYKLIFKIILKLFIKNFNDQIHIDILVILYSKIKEF